MSKYDFSSLIHKDPILLIKIIIELAYTAEHKLFWICQDHNYLLGNTGVNCLLFSLTVTEGNDPSLIGKYWLNKTRLAWDTKQHMLGNQRN